MARRIQAKMTDFNVEYVRNHYEKYLKRTRMKKHTFANKIGHDSGYLPECFRRGRINIEALNKICEITKADPEKAKLPAQEEKDLPEPSKVDEINIELDGESHKWRIVAEELKMLRLQNDRLIAQNGEVLKQGVEIVNVLNCLKRIWEK